MLETYKGRSDQFWSILTSIGNYFLRGCKALETLDFIKFGAVTSVGNGFLDGCVKLTMVDLTKFGAVTSVGDNFLAGCLHLPAVNLTKFVCSFDERGPLLPL